MTHETGSFDPIPVITEKVREHRSLKEDHRLLRKNREFAADHANMANEVIIEFNKESKGRP